VRADRRTINRRRPDCTGPNRVGTSQGGRRQRSVFHGSGWI